MPAQTDPLRYREKTFGQLYTMLRDRLAFIRQGAASNNNKPLLTSFLQEAHQVLCDEIGPLTSKKRTVIQLEPGSCLYDFHNDIENEIITPANIISVWLKRSESERDFLPQGITEMDRSQTDRGAPTKYDTLNGQIEVWPVPDAFYGMVVEYIAPPGPFSQDSHLCSVDWLCVFLYALQAAQAHYRRPEANRTLEAFNSRLKRIKSNQHENRRFFVNPYSKAQRTVTGHDGKYTYVSGGGW